MERRARRDNAIGRKRRSSRAPSDADATPRQTAWFIIIAGEESGVYEGMRWDGWDERAKPQLGNIFGASYVTEMYGSNDKKDGN